jgi:D-xylulose reductase
MVQWCASPRHLALTLKTDGVVDQIEPLAVGIHALASVGQLRSTQNVIIFGCGPVGLLAMAAARALGANRVVACDIVPSRLEFAKEYAATDVWAPIVKNDGESPITYATRNAAALMAALGFTHTGLEALDLVVDASGAPASVQTGLLVAKAGGTYVQVGMGHPELAIPVISVLAREITIRGSFRYGVRSSLYSCPLSR